MRRAAWHPFLFAAYPILFLYAANLGQFVPGVVLLPLAVALGAAAAILGLLWWALRDKHKAAAIASLFLLLFLSYGQVYQAVRLFRLPLGSATLGPNALLFPAWCAAVGLGAYLLVRTRRNLEPATPVLNLVAAALVLLSLVRIGVYFLRWGGTGGSGSVAQAAAGLAAPGAAQADPHIFYLILDGYARADVLEEFFGYDNSALVDYLRGKGFYVAERSKANYAQTALSLGSALNMTYLDDVASELGPKSDNLIALRPLIEDSAVARTLRQRGYSIVSFPSGYGLAEMTTADWTLGGFENGLLNLTPIPAVLDSLDPGYQFDAHRQRILGAFDRLPELAEAEGPAFVFAHILAPHPPFVFKENGEAARQEGAFSLWDYRHPDYQEGYAQQVTFLNHKLRAAIDGILERANRPVVIVLQSDHGPASRMDWSAPSDEAIQERMPILNAYLLPDAESTSPYDQVSPVNSFRLILDHYFGAGLPLLPDRSYFSSINSPYQWRDVTDLVERILP